LRVPGQDDIPKRPVPTPTNVCAKASPSGVVITWNAVYGAYGYEVNLRHNPGDAWGLVYTMTNRHDQFWCIDGEVWQFRVRSCCGDGDDVRSDWSEIVTATAHPRTAPPPKNISTRSTESGFVVNWDPPGWDVDRYGVLYLDRDVPGSMPSAVGVRDTRAEIDGLNIGHRYGVAVQTWTDAGGSFLGPAPDVVIGG
jgi:hypothetical protein